jgi:hypothetical protein
MKASAPRKTAQNLADFRPKPVTVEQLNAIDILVTGASDAEVAKVVGVTRDTVNYWQNHNPVFMAELEKARQSFMAQAIDALRAALLKAVKVLVAAVEAGDLRAAIELLKTIGLHGAHERFAPGEMDAGKITERLALEQLCREGVKPNKNLDRLISQFDNNPDYQRRKSEIVAELVGNGDKAS